MTIKPTLALGGSFLHEFSFKVRSPVVMSTVRLCGIICDGKGWIKVAFIHQVSESTLRNTGFKEGGGGARTSEDIEKHRRVQPQQTMDLSLSARMCSGSRFAGVRVQLQIALY